jgi:hypothetical protein
VKSPADLAALDEVAGKQQFLLGGIRRDEAARTLTIPFERKFPRRESWSLQVRGVRSFRLGDRKEQATDFFRAFRHDAKSGVLEIEGVLVMLRLEVDALDLEARCLTAEEAPKWDVADLPEPIRREADERGTETLREQERFARADRVRHGLMTAAGALVLVIFGLGFRNPVWALLLDLLAGAGAGWLIAHKQWAFVGFGAVVVGVPGAVLSLSGSLVRSLSSPDGGFAGLTYFLFIGVEAAAGGGLAALNAGLMRQVQDRGAQDRSEAAPTAPLDPAFPRRAAVAFGLGSALLYGVFRAPVFVWALAAPLGSGGLAYLLALRRAPSRTTGRLFGVLGIALSLGAAAGGTILPAAVLIAGLHFVAGLMLAYYSRGEGPR